MTNWQKSSYCGEGEACIHLSLAETIHLTESADPSGAILNTTPSALAALLNTLKDKPHG